MAHASLPVSFCAYALYTLAYILNLVPSKSVSLTPHEMWTKFRPSLSHLKIWGCPAYVLTRGSKLEPGCSILWGYTKATRGGHFCHPSEQKLFVSTNVRYLEEDKKLSFRCSKEVDLEVRESDSQTSNPMKILDDTTV